MRYTSKLDPSLKLSGNWATEEDQAILDGRQAGNTWGAIAATTPGRAPNDVKNRFNGNFKHTLHLKWEFGTATKVRAAAECKARLARLSPRCRARGVRRRMAIRNESERR